MMRLPAAFCAVLLIATFGLAADDPEPDMTPLSSAQASSEEVAATVNDEPISVGMVNELAASVLQGRPVNPSSLQQIKAEVLAQLIDRTLITQALKQKGKQASAEIVSKALEQVKQQAAEQKVDFASMLAERKISEEQFRDQIAWQLNWGQYVKENLTDAVLRKYFEAHQRDLDGTELRVSHILLRPDGIGSTVETERLKKMAEKLREQIDSGKMTFAQAAEKYSAGPSRHKEGDLGYIPRQGLMVEAFASAAFKLSPGKISDPVVTPYGVHLIKVTDTKKGRKKWMEVKEALKGPTTQALFDKLAAESRANANIIFSGKSPHFKLGTKELAE